MRGLTTAGLATWRLFQMAGVRLGFALVPLLPRRAVLGLAALLGGLGYRLLRRDRRIALANLDLAFGSALPPARKRAIARASFTLFSRTLLDTMWFSRGFEARMRRWVTIEDSTAPYVAAGPAIAVTAHFGNWELLGQTAAFLGAPPVTVAAGSRNPRLDRYITWQRERHGLKVVLREGAMRDLWRALKGRGHVALVIDQHIRPSEGGVWVTFFGKAAAMSPAAGVLAERFGASVIPGFCMALPDGRYRVYAHAPLPAGPAVNQRIAAAFEREIRANPEQWLWMYKRWKYAPAGGDLAGYPYYSRPAQARNQEEDT